MLILVIPTRFADEKGHVVLFLLQVRFSFETSSSKFRPIIQAEQWIEMRSYFHCYLSLTNRLGVYLWVLPTDGLARFIYRNTMYIDQNLQQQNLNPSFWIYTVIFCWYLIKSAGYCYWCCYPTLLPELLPSADDLSLEGFPLEMTLVNWSVGPS